MNICSQYVFTYSVSRKCVKWSWRSSVHKAFLQKVLGVQLSTQTVAGKTEIHMSILFLCCIHFQNLMQIREGSTVCKGYNFFLAKVVSLMEYCALLILLFSPSRGRSGMRSAWGGEIGGAGVDTYSSPGTVLDSSLVPIHRPVSSSTGNSKEIQLDAVRYGPDY